ncbi:head GIN domain-containing protein [Lutibacter aestuarii]|uniref:Head GIN domain-containing protein n=1 Tax=Lutibacter aestuarii TaxID=861111 RepID=A0ABW2Z9K3_9FLAO|nr:head GIN domain-containing protein [uncultured Lutibacter sp.]
MKKITLLLILISTLGMSQETITTKLGDFHTLKVFNGLTVELQKAATSKVVISGSQSEDVSIKNADGVLKIRLHFPDSFTAEDVKIVLFYSKDIDALDANEGGKIFSDETLKQQHLEVRTQEGAKINLAVNTKHLTVKSVSGGIIELTGVTENQTVEATTGGIYEAFEMQSKQAIVTAASGANVEVSTSEILDAKVRFGGNIYYKGTPEVLKTKKVIGGKIVDKN